MAHTVTDVTLNAKRVKLSELRLDPHNANMGTDRGRAALEGSIAEFGFIESGLLDDEFNVISGNKRTVALDEVTGAEEIMVIDIDGTVPIYFRYKDTNLLDPTDKKARRMAFALNRVGQLSLKWNSKQVEEAIAAGVDLSDLFMDEELANMRVQIDPNQDMDLDEFDSAVPKDVFYRVVIDGLDVSKAKEISDTLPNARIEQYRK